MPTFYSTAEKKVDILPPYFNAYMQVLAAIQQHPLEQSAVLLQGWDAAASSEGSAASHSDKHLT